MRLAALRHVESSWSRDQTPVPFTGRWTQSLDHQGSPQCPLFFFLQQHSFCNLLLRKLNEGSIPDLVQNSSYLQIGSKVFSVILWLMNSLGTKFFHHNNMFLKILLEFFWSAVAYDKNTSPHTFYLPLPSWRETGPTANWAERHLKVILLF